MGCPICGGEIGYRSGSDLPCKKCKQEYAAVEKSLPAGVDIMDWGSARNAGKAALARGESLQAAQRIVQATMQQWLKVKHDLAEAELQRRLGDRCNEDPRIDQLFD